MTVYELEVPLLHGKPPLTHNQRLHHMAKAKRVAAVREAVGWEAVRHKLPKNCSHIVVQLHYATGDNRLRDAPNLTATSKPGIDGLKDAGVVADDHDGYVTEIMPVIHRGPGKRRLWLAVEIGPAGGGEAGVPSPSAEPTGGAE